MPTALSPDAAACVAALTAAGSDVDTLTAAIARSTALDATPGDGRQALRAARTRLRAALAAAAAKAAADAASGAASPHTKASYDSAEFSTLSSKFETLAWRALSKPGGATVKPDEYYALAALAAQVTDGDVTGERPMWAERGGLELYYEFSPKALYSDGR